MKRLVWALPMCVLACATVAAPAFGDDWLPHAAGAKWTYQWWDTTYNPNGTIEQVAASPTAGPNGCGWQLAWTGDTQVPLGGSSPSSGPAPVIDSPDNGAMCFTDQSYGLENTDWSSSPAPINEPSLCANPSSCPNSLSSTLYDVIWGARNPVISEPLLRGTTWNATGGGDGSVRSTSRYLGLQLVRVPAFPSGVVAAAVESEIALAGTPGDDWGTGTRTTWWVRGVGPVKVVFDHVDGSVTTAQLNATNLRAGRARPDANYFPMKQGAVHTYRWTNAKHLPRPEIETVTTKQVVNRSASYVVRSRSGPIRAAGDYVFSIRLDGLRNTYGATSGATLLRLPAPGHGRHFFSPFDMMTYGFNPVMPAYPTAGTTWKSGNAYDLKTFGVTGRSTVLGIRTVRVPAGTFQALVVRSTLTQPHNAFGSGVRTMWFAPNVGLVRLVFRHRDGSTSDVEMTK